ncbi:MAG: hypothetical protein EHM72_10595 [Calditrichaeota bacterium]|nr:MAG: hypothetical protein EHM72_10595 [Calditrichota bacterium]
MKSYSVLLICSLFCCAGKAPRFADERLAAATISLSDKQTPARIDGAVYTLTKPAKAEKELIKLIQSKKELFKLEAPAKELSLNKSDVDQLGFRHVTFSRVHKGVPLWAEELKLHVNQQQELYLIQGQYSPSLPATFNVKPQLSAEQAEDKVRSQLSLQTVQQDETKLYILNDQETPRLVWRVIAATAKLAPDQWECLIDAASGELLSKTNLIRP